jgi:hypothetical protein
MRTYIALLAAGLYAVPSRGEAPCGLALPPSTVPLGSLAPRSSLSAPPSRWSVGGETLDRGFTNFSAWAPYLGPLGASAVRLQAGWARCEPRAGGAYDWAWLDAAVDGALAVGVEPWLQLSFGNPQYADGGSAAVGSPLPSGAAALAAWDAWVRAVVQRFAPRLGSGGGGGTWEIWNEPNIQHINASAYAIFALRTAAVVRAAAPRARVRVGAVAGTDAHYAAAFAAGVAGKGMLLDEFTYHPYDYNPDASYAGVAALRSALDAGGLAHVALAQGESGAPSVGGGYGALTAYNWTQCSQAKWFSRRLLGDSARGIPSSAFSIADLCYGSGSSGSSSGGGGGGDGQSSISVNHKGLLAADCAAPGFPVLGPKAAYAAVQHVMGAVDGTFTALPPAAGLRVVVEAAACSALPAAAIYAGAWSSARGELVFALWNASGTPLGAAAASTALCDVTLTLTAAAPPPSGQGAYAGVDVLTGAAFSVVGGLAASAGSSSGSSSSESAPLRFVFRALPLSDTPLLLAPPAALRLVPPPAPASPPPPFSLGVGTNLGNTLEAPLEGQWAPAAQEVFFDDFVAAGFATVRIPVRWDNHTLPAPPFTVDAAWMARVQTVAGWCTARGLQCIINSHWDAWLDTNSTADFAAALPRYAAIWTQVAAAFAGAPASLYFESFNEPHIVDTPKLNALLAAFYAAVRPLHPTRRLILGWLNYMGPSWIEEGHAANWNAMAIPTLPGGAPDPNLAVETHSYDPYDVCGHPVRAWDSQPSDILNMDFMFRTLSNWSAAHGNMPVFMGESGCTRKQNQSSRVAWYAAFFERVKAAPGLAGGLVWDDDGSFAVYNRSTRAFDQEVLRAIGL